LTEEITSAPESHEDDSPIAALPDLEALPDRSVPTIHECPKGHRQLGPNRKELTNRWNGQVALSTGNICRECEFAFYSENFPTFDTGIKADVGPR
jgi:hypothetical protein